MRERDRGQPFDELFDEDLNAALERAAAQHRAVLTRHLTSALERVRDRGTPLRGVEAFDSDGTVRLRFADGTTLLARGDGKGGLAMAAVAVVQGRPVLLTEVEDDGLVVQGVLSWPRRRHASIEALGDDQPT